ncbi:MAG TPA: YnfA family protein [Nitrososphaera sp.]|nr:YnfA family protein [Nitrososphaera sp.]
MQAPLPPLVTLALFFAAAIAEIGGGYLVWLWLRGKKTVVLGALGGIILFVYGIILTLQPAEFGRVYAAYGGIFIVSAIIWGRIVDKKKPDRYEIIGSIVSVIGTSLAPLSFFMLLAEPVLFNHVIVRV